MGAVINPPPPKKQRKKKRKYKTSENVFLVYEIISTATTQKYVGFTATIGSQFHNQALQRRFSKHLTSAKTSNCKLYVEMRRFGVETFSIRLLKVFVNLEKPGIFVKEEALAFELALIKSGKYELNSSHEVNI